MSIQEKNAEMRKTYHAAGYTGKNVVFAVLDTGVNPVGPLRYKVTGDADGADHGTFTASIIHEYCPDSQIWAYRCDTPNAMIEAMEDVLRRAKGETRRVVINMSLSTEAERIQAAVDACVAAGIPLVCAAGNDGQEILDMYPSCFASPITVAALDDNGKRAYFSTWHGEVDFADLGQWVEGINAEGDKDQKSGTSFAAPQVAGKIGLLLSARPGMTEPEIYESLKGMCVDLDKTGRDPYTGYGFVQLPEPKEQTEPPKEDEPMEDRILKLVGKPRMQGDDVKELQTLLNEHGFACDVDGIFGPGTDAAVCEFQEANGLAVDGIVGASTWAALRSEPVAGAITADQLASEFKGFLAQGRGYVYGAQGELYTQELAEQWHEQAKAGKRSVPNGRDKNNYFVGDCSKWIGKYIDDCSGGIVDAIRKYIPSYKDRTANGFRAGFVRKGSISTLPDIPGVALWYSGHIGVYVGEGYAIEFRGTDYGCVKTKVSDRNWQEWGEIEGVTYDATEPSKPDAPSSGDTKPYYGICIGGSVNVRTGGSTDYPAIGVVHKDDKLLVLPTGGWPQVALELDGKLMVGYMSDKYVGEV